MIQVVVYHWELIFSLLTSPKFVLVEVEKAMFESVACYFQLLFGLLTIPECDLGEFGKAMFQVLERHLKLFSVSILA